MLPLAELGWPRIDVLMDISSVFCDTFQTRIFSQARELYGTGVDELIEEGQWEQSDELVAMNT
jgi:cobalamin biosynthesis Mg chelatase CobN